MTSRIFITPPYGLQGGRPSGFTSQGGVGCGPVLIGRVGEQGGRRLRQRLVLPAEFRRVDQVPGAVTPLPLQLTLVCECDGNSIQSHIKHELTRDRLL